MATTPPSSFVTVTAWLSLAMAAVGVLVGVPQTAIFLIARPDHLLLQALSDFPPDLTFPPALMWLIEHSLLLSVLSLLSSLVLVLVSWGLLRRRTWGRYGFILALVLGAALTFAGTFLIDSWLQTVMLTVEQDHPIYLKAVFLRISLYVSALAIGVLHGGIIWKLSTAPIRAEFR